VRLITEASFDEFALFASYADAEAHQSLIWLHSERDVSGDMNRFPWALFDLRRDD